MSLAVCSTVRHLRDSLTLETTSVSLRPLVPLLAEGSFGESLWLGLASCHSGVIDDSDHPCPLLLADAKGRYVGKARIPVSEATVGGTVGQLICALADIEVEVAGLIVLLLLVIKLSEV